MDKPSPSRVVKRFEDNMGTSLAVRKNGSRIFGSAAVLVGLERRVTEAHMNLVAHSGASPQLNPAARRR